MTPNEAMQMVAALAPLCKEQGIRRIVVAGMEIDFGPPRPDMRELQAFTGALDATMPTDEDALKWSQPDYTPSWDRKKEAK